MYRSSMDNEQKNAGARQAWREPAMNAIAIAAFAVPGVVARIVLDSWLSSCPRRGEPVGIWAPCVTQDASHFGGAIFTALPANMVACFLSGLLAPTKTIDPDGNHGYKASPVALLPSTWRLQGYAPLWVGVRTGGMGSFSTFASMNLQLVKMACNQYHQGHQIVAALVGYLFGAALPLSMFALGGHIAAYIHLQRIKSEGGVLPESHHPEPSSSTSSPAARPAASVGLMREDTTTSSGSVPHGAPSGRVVELTEVSTTMESAALPSAGSNCGETPARDSNVVSANDTERYSLAADICMCCLLVVVVAVAGVLAAVFPDVRVHAFACLLGPPGAWLRWILSRFNGQWGRLSWLPAGTLLANLMASTLDTLLAGFSAYCTAKTDGTFVNTTGYFTILAVVDGFSGSLSTVSTFITEAYAMLQGDAINRMRSYAYISLSFLASLVLGVVTYGPFLWSVDA